MTTLQSKVSSFHISNLISKQSYFDFLELKRKHKNITECQYKLIKTSFDIKNKKNNNFFPSMNNIINDFLQLFLKDNNNYYLTRLQILLNYYYSNEETNKIIKNIIKKDSYKITLPSITKKSIITHKKNCIIYNNTIFYIYNSYLKYLNKIKNEKIKMNNILFICYEITEEYNIYIKDIKDLFKINIDILSNDLKTNIINDNQYDIIFVMPDFVYIQNLKQIFEEISRISKENGILYVFGNDIFTVEDQYINLINDTIERNIQSISYPLNLFEIEFILLQNQFKLFYSNELHKTYSQIPSFIQKYYGMFINRKI